MSSAFYRSLEMSLTPEAFERGIGAALASDAYTLANRTLCHETPGHRLRIRYEQQAQRRIGALRLPVLQLDFEFQGYTEEEIEAFMQRFKLYFQQGGG